jgi:prepilin-type N-terminal cleavage/methylation domain-containing protein
MRASDRTSQNGFSLLELVVAVGVLTIVMGAAFQLMARSQTSFDRNQFSAEAHQNADFAVNRVTEIIRGTGSNPHNDAYINSLVTIANVSGVYSGQASAEQAVRLRADLDGDKQTDDFVDSSVSGAGFFILSSEDLILLYVEDDANFYSTDVPGGTIVMIDNNRTPLKPVVIAENIAGFSCPVTGDPSQVTLTITAGPTHNVAPNDPRYVTFTRTMQIRLRNR